MSAASSRTASAGVTSARTAARRALLAEGLGTALLLAVVVGSGIMGERLSEGNVAVALLANAAATFGGLYVLIVLLGPISGAHFNPAVSLVMRLRGGPLAAPLWAYVAMQVLGGLLGVGIAHAMFGEPLWQPGDQVRSGGAQWFSEAVATFGLLLTILLGVRHRAQSVPLLVAAYIFAAYWFTASTSFANPAVTLARGFTQTFAGIRLVDVAGFALAQIAGALIAWQVTDRLLGAAEAEPSND
jgi:glycerol uptake facilitator-like aquaporin